GRERLDRDVEPGDDLAEVLEIRVERRDHPRVLVVELEDRAVADHLAGVVAERRVPDPPALESEHVVGEDAIRGAQRVLAAEVPLPERRLVPDADTLAHSTVLRARVPE